MKPVIKLKFKYIIKVMVNYHLNGRANRTHLHFVFLGVERLITYFAFFKTNWFHIKFGILYLNAYAVVLSTLTIPKEVEWQIGISMLIRKYNLSLNIWSNFGFLISFIDLNKITKIKIIVFTHLMIISYVG